MTHPLSMMTTEEAEAVKAILDARGRTTDDTRYHGFRIHEPAKALVAAHEAGDTQLGRAFDVVVRQGGEVYSAVVRLDADADHGGTVEDWTHHEGAVPRIGILEISAVQAATRAMPEFQAAIAKRGITDMDQVQIDPWPTGDYGFDFEAGRRVARCIAFWRPNPDDNGYAYPIDGIMAHVDVDTHELLHLEDHGTWQMADEPGNYDVESVTANYGPMRTDLRTIDITQPDGPSFTIDDNLLSWQKWSMRIVSDDTEGLVIHRLRYDDGGDVRAIADRLSLAEMVVPYGDTRPSQAFKHALDAGEFGLGLLTNSLTLGCDCLGEILYLDANQVLDDGTVFTIENAVCIHEEDFGIGWKHTDMSTGNVEVRRARRLVVSSIYTVGNYEYGVFWYFHMDGTIRCEIKLTGIMTTRSHGPDDDLTYARQIAPHLSAPIHQHLFCVRMDMAIDGNANSVVEVNTEPLPSGPDNPWGTAFAANEQRFGSESEAQRNTNSATSRYWRIESTERTNRLGRPTAFRLLPGSTATMMAAPDSPHGERAGFARHNLWVTPTEQEERWAAGRFPTQRNAGEGLPKWTAADRNVDGTDVTVWHTFGLTHDARVEDWPVMPTEYASFMLVPDGFFERNPALDVPPSAEGHCH